MSPRPPSGHMRKHAQHRLSCLTHDRAPPSMDAINLVAPTSSLEELASFFFPHHCSLTNLLCMFNLPKKNDTPFLVQTSNSICWQSLIYTITNRPQYQLVFELSSKKVFAPSVFHRWYLLLSCMDKRAGHSESV